MVLHLRVVTHCTGIYQNISVCHFQITGSRQRVIARYKSLSGKRFDYKVTWDFPRLADALLQCSGNPRQTLWTLYTSNRNIGRERLETRSRFDIQNRQDPSRGPEYQSSEARADPTQVALFFPHIQPQTLPITSTGRPMPVFESPKDVIGEMREPLHGPSFFSVLESITSQITWPYSPSDTGSGPGSTTLAGLGAGLRVTRRR